MTSFVADKYEDNLLAYVYIRLEVHQRAYFICEPHLSVEEMKRRTEHTIGFAGRRSTNDNGERSTGQIEE